MRRQASKRRKAVDDRFGEWLRDALADMDDDVLIRRWAGVESLASDLDYWEIMDLILYCTQCRKHRNETILKVKQAFWKHDRAFKMNENDLELRRLSGAIVIHVLCGKSTHQMDIALACVCLSFGGLHNDIGLPAMVEEAEKVLQDLSVRIRTKGPVQKVTQRVITPSKFLTKLKEMMEQGEVQVPIDDLHEIFSQYGKGLNQIAKDNRQLQIALEIQKEETNILWWLMGAYSNDLEQSFGNLDKPIAAVIAGKELADHVTHRPGPLSVINILDRIVSHRADNADALSLDAVVTKIPMDWKRKLSQEINDRTLDFCPLHAAISHSVELEDDVSWKTIFSKHFPYSTAKEVSPIVLGYQMYRERILALNLGVRE